MPIILDNEQKKTTPHSDVPETEYPAGHILEVVIVTPFPGEGESYGDGWWAETRIVPMTADGTKVLHEAAIKLRIDNLWASMKRCPELAAAMGPLIAGIHAYNQLVIADKKAAEEVEAARLAQIEADRVVAEQARAAAEQARLDVIEAARLVEIERQRLADEAEAKRLEEYNSPTAKAARKQAALDEAAAIEVQAKEAQEVADLAAIEAAKPEVVAAVEVESLRQVAYDAQQKQSIAEQLAVQAAVVRTAAEAMEG